MHARGPLDLSPAKAKAMHAYAQTNIQLFNQLRSDGYSKADLDLVRNAYELAMVLFSGRFQPSGKSFIAHVVGTASILASLGLPAPVVAAGLLHNLYEKGDFSDGRTGVSKARRRKIRNVLGSDVETYVAKFPALYWEPKTIWIARHAPDKLDPAKRAVLLILFADHLEHLLDLDLLYYEERAKRFLIERSEAAVEIAAALGAPRLARELSEAIRKTESSEPPAWSSKHRARSNAFVVVPRSCRKRVSAAARGRANECRRNVLKRVRLLHQKSPDFVKNAIRWMIQRPSPAAGLEIKSSTFPQLFPKNATPVRVATGFRFTEGPVWIEQKKSLLFSDIPGNRIYELTADGRVATFREPGGNSNGLTRDKKGRLIACEHGNRRVTRTEADGSITVLAETFHSKRLNSPNDVVGKSDGAIYFTDPSYGIKPEEQEQPVQGVYRLSADGSELTLVADDFASPNGLAFSPDEKKLYIDDSHRRHIRVCEVRDDGSLAGGSLFHDMDVQSPGAPDGMKVDVEGRVYCTGAGGVWVFDPAGNHLGTIVTPEKPSNCAWGDDDRRSLYITAVTSVYRMRVNTPGTKVP
jgi:gluconolactonase